MNNLMSSLSPAPLSQQSMNDLMSSLIVITVISIIVFVPAWYRPVSKRSEQAQVGGRFMGAQIVMIVVAVILFAYFRLTFQESGGEWNSHRWDGPTQTWYALVSVVVGYLAGACLKRIASK